MGKRISTQNDLYKFQKNIKRIVSIFLIISIVISAIFFATIFLINRQLNRQTYKSLVDNANKNLQYNLSAQFAIIANDPNFISYLRSGDVSRQKYFSSIRWTFSNFDPKLIKGVKIINSINQNIFSYGKPTDFFTKIDICYLGNKINSSLGGCDDSMIVYFNSNEYLLQLHKLEPHIVTDENSTFKFYYQPFSAKFGLFHSSSYSTNNLLNVSVSYETPNFFLISIIFALSIFLTCLLISHRYLKAIIEKELIVPIKHITDSLYNSEHKLSTKPEFLAELNTLIEVVNKYNTQQVYTKLETVAGEMAHKLNNPINGIRAVMPKIKLNSPATSELSLLERYINSIYNLTSKILHDFRESSSEYKSHDNLSQPRYFIVEQSINQIINDFKIHHDQCDYLVTCNSTSWIYTAPIELEDTLVNLLNNSYESLTSQQKSITINTIQHLRNVIIEIKDTGHGIPKQELINVQLGKSLKHVGNGIGLNSAIKYFQSLQGSLNLESQEGSGTTVTITIPLSTPSWWRSQIPYTDNTIFFIVTDDMYIISEWQKIFLYIDNSKFYFTELEGALKYIKQTITPEILLVTTNRFYNQITKENSYNIFKNIYLICETAPDYEVQKTLSALNHYAILKTQLTASILTIIK
ncbi:MAG: HAMP domain-containing sensor histidine kinase [Burkholderiales bacterium]|nr:HAMP domain-containing sensor histidine kinase [Burkholderiales bacterium]